jgi:hypothetical protein
MTMITRKIMQLMKIVHVPCLDNIILPYLIIKTRDFPHCSDCLQLENIALGHLTTINDNDNKENYATDEDSACTMTLTVPNAIKKVVIFKNGKRYCLEI